MSGRTIPYDRATNESGHINYVTAIKTSKLTGNYCVYKEMQTWFFFYEHAIETLFRSMPSNIAVFKTKPVVQYKVV